MPLFKFLKFLKSHFWTVLIFREGMSWESERLIQMDQLTQMKFYFEFWQHSNDRIHSRPAMVTNTLQVLTDLVLTTNDVGAIILNLQMRKLKNKEVK